MVNEWPFCVLDLPPNANDPNVCKRLCIRSHTQTHGPFEFIVPIGNLAVWFRKEEGIAQASKQERKCGQYLELSSWPFILSSSSSSIYIAFSH